MAVAAAIAAAKPHENLKSSRVIEAESIRRKERGKAWL